jgi:hypothetical protein
MFIDSSKTSPVAPFEEAAVLFREISCSFVDRVLTIRSHTIRGGVPTRAARVGCQEITPSDTKEHEIAKLQKKDF